MLVERAVGQGVRQTLVAGVHDGPGPDRQGQVQAVVDRPARPDGQFQGGIDEIGARRDAQRQPQHIRHHLTCFVFANFAPTTTFPDHIGDLGKDEVGGMQLSFAGQQRCSGIAMLLLKERRSNHAGIDNTSLHRSRSLRIRASLLRNRRPASRFFQPSSISAISSAPVSYTHLTLPTSSERCRSR
ncbi:MAG: hypothetical protein QUV05_14195, partial [Phycisphaerae bacterium]|nr:hypothetical protein [Phycisphaerae bacterium]